MTGEGLVQIRMMGLPDFLQSEVDIPYEVFLMEGEMNSLVVEIFTGVASQDSLAGACFKWMMIPFIIIHCARIYVAITINRSCSTGWCHLLIAIRESDTINTSAPA